MSYTVVVCAHNEEEYILNALKSIFNQTVKPEKVIVVLDRCTDKTGDIAKLFPVEIIEKNEAKWKYSYAENLEIARKHVNSKFYAIVDADVILEPKYFEILLKEVGDRDACVGGRIITSCKTILCKLLSLWERTYALSPWRRPRGCALLIRKDVLDEIGGFADVPAPDTHVQEHATKLGYQVRVVGKVKAYHVRKITFKRAIKTQFQTGIARYKQGIGLTRTLLHSIARLRPFVILGYIYALIKDKFRRQ
ncbi:MAG: glycosyltransferase [archaeon YNP-LCB-024-027]|nr:glycosyltransferase [Candidatus Culexarchaeum yellowstonense]